jgi:hypothetical protein
MKKVNFNYVIIILAVIVLVVIGSYFYFKTPMKIEKLVGQYKVDEKYLVDQSDVQYYKDIEGEYKNRMKYYTPFTVSLEKIQDTQIEPELNEYYVDNYVVRDYLNQGVSVDSQNVHDTVIQNNVKNKYKSLKTDYSDPDSITRDILAFCNNEKEVADVIHKIKKRNAKLVNFEGDTEMEILEKTWKNGNQSVQAQIINELKDCKKDNDIYCPSGVATRIVSALYIETPENFPKSKDTINREILGKCSHLRNKNPEITQEELLEEMVIEYNDVHDKEFITDLMEPWIGHI